MSRSHSKRSLEDSWRRIEKLKKKQEKLARHIGEWAYHVCTQLRYIIMLHSAEREKRRAQTKSKSGSRRRELIIRPAGKAGCDWNLCERMGLVDNKQEYNRIRVLICAFFSCRQVLKHRIYAENGPRLCHQMA